MTLRRNTPQELKLQRLTREVKSAGGQEQRIGAYTFLRSAYRLSISKDDRPCNFYVYLGRNSLSNALSDPYHTLAIVNVMDFAHRIPSKDFLLLERQPFISGRAPFILSEFDTLEAAIAAYVILNHDT